MDCSRIILAILSYFIVKSRTQEEEIISKVILSQPFKTNRQVLVAPDNADNSNLQLRINLYKSINIDNHGGNVGIASIKALSQSWDPLIFLAFEASELEVIFDIINSKGLGKDGNNVLVIDNTPAKELHTSGYVQLDQIMFVIRMADLKMYETYTVNGIKVSNTVGYFELSGDNQLAFVFDLTWSPNLRNNFHGAHLTALTEQSPPYSVFVQDYLKKAKYFETNQTYDVTNLVSGVYHDIIDDMAEHLNFTYSVYKRRDGVWGTVVDGKPKGMLGNLADGSADLIAADFGMNLYRLSFCRHLPIITPLHLCIVINNNLPEKLEFGTYTFPYRGNLWLSIGICSFVIAFWLYHSNKSKSLVNCIPYFISWYWTTMTTYIGSPPLRNKLKVDSLSNRIVVIVCFLGGVILWMGYQAGLMSELAIVKVVYPFHNLETLLSSDYEAGTFYAGTTISDVFEKAAPGSTYDSIYQAKLKGNVNGFVGTKQGLDLVLASDQYAFVHYFDDVVATSKFLGYDCMLTFVWKAKVPVIYGSLATPKNSSYYPVLAKHLWRMRVSGKIDALKWRHMKGEPNCLPYLKEFTKVSIKKLVAPFVIVGIGVLLSLLMLGSEIVLQMFRQGPDAATDDETEFEEAFDVIEKNLDSWTNSDTNHLRKRDFILQELMLCFLD